MNVRHLESHEMVMVESTCARAEAQASTTNTTAMIFRMVAPEMCVARCIAWLFENRIVDLTCETSTAQHFPPLPAKKDMPLEKVVRTEGGSGCRISLDGIPGFSVVACENLAGNVLFRHRNVKQLLMRSPQSEIRAGISRTAPGSAVAELSWNSIAVCIHGLFRCDL
jgi:hypothetical protein